jgi:hypothetical protein
MFSSNDPTPIVPPAETHADAIELFRRPFAPGAIGFRAMTKAYWTTAGSGASAAGHQTPRRCPDAATTVRRVRGPGVMKRWR